VVNEESTPKASEEKEINTSEEEGQQIKRRRTIPAPDDYIRQVEIESNEVGDCIKVLLESKPVSINFGPITYLVSITS
jgi:hypothetical protein